MSNQGTGFNFGASGIWDGLNSVLDTAERIGGRILDWDIRKIEHDLYKDQVRSGLLGGLPNSGTSAAVPIGTPSAGWGDPGMMGGIDYQKWGLWIGVAGIAIALLTYFRSR